MANVVSPVIILLNRLKVSNPKANSDCVKKQDPTMCCLSETHLKSKDINRLKKKGQKRYGMQTIIIRAGMAVVIS